MYPELASESDDDKLTHAVLKVHPELKGSVVDVLEGSENAPAPSSYLPSARDLSTPPPVPAPPGTPGKSGFVDNRKVKGAGTASATAAVSAPPPPVGHIGAPPPQAAIENRLGGVEDTIGPLGPTLMTPIRGVVQAAAGLGKLFGMATDPVQVSKIATNPFDAVQAVADIVSGSMKAGSVVLPEAVLVAPLETITGLLAGGATAEAVRAGLTKLGAHPAVVQLASDLAAIVAGGGMSHAAGTEGRLEGDFAGASQAKDATFRADREAADDQTSLDKAQNFANQVEQIKKLHEQLNTNEGLRQWAAEQKAAGNGPFDALDAAKAKISAQTAVAQPPPQLGPAPEPAGLLPPARPIVGAPSGMPIEAVGGDAPVVSQPSEPAEAVKARENEQFQADQLARLNQDLDANERLRQQVAQPPPPPSGDPGARLLPPTSRYNEIVGSGQPLDSAARDMIDSYSRVPPVASEPPPAPKMLPEQAGPAGSKTRPTVVAAPEGSPIETVGSKPPLVSQPSRPFPELVQSVGEHLSSQLQNQRGSDQPRLSPEAEARVQDHAKVQQRTRAYYQEALRDSVKELAESTYEPGGLSEGIQSRGKGDEAIYARRTAGTPLYRMIVGKETENPQSQSYIAAIAKAMDETGAKTSRDLPPLGDEKAGEVTATNRLMHGLGLTTEAGTKRAFDVWSQHIRGVVEDRAASRMAADDAQSPESGAPVSVQPTGEESAATTTQAVGSRPPAVEADGGQAPPVEGSQSDPIPVGHVRLYRGEGGPSTGTLPRWVREGLTQSGAADASGRWFTDDPEIAKWYQEDAGTSGRIVTVDVPQHVADAARVAGNPELERFSKDPSREFFIPREYADQRQVGSPPPAADPGPAGNALPKTNAWFDTVNARLGGLEPGGGVATPPPGVSGDDMPQFLKDLGNEPAGPTPAGRLPFWERMTGEEGHLILDVRPGDNAGLKKWLTKTEPEYGDQDWHQMAQDALDMGEPETAWKLANIAAARSFAASTGGNAAKGKQLEDIPDVAKMAERKKLELAEVQKQVGEKLPRGTTIESGVVKLPGNPGGLDPKVTDLTMGRVFAKTLVDLTDPNTIVRITDAEGKVPGDLPKSLQMANQMADQFLRETPDDLLEPLMEDLGVSRTQLAAHFARKISDAGRVLGMVGNWVQANEENFIHLDPDLATTKGPGAAGRMEFVPEDRADVIANYMDILRRKGLTTKLLDNMEKSGYEAPEGMDPGSKAAQADARAWLRTRQKQITAGKVVDAVAKKYNDPDTIMAAMGDQPPVGKAIEDISQMSLAAMLTQQATAMKILLSHGVRYGLGTFEEGLAGVSARLKGDLAGSTQHFTQADRMASTPFTQLDYLPSGLLHSPMSDNLETLFNYTKTADPNSVDKFFQALDQFPQEKARLTGARLQEGSETPQTTLGRVRNLLTIGIRASMMATRAAVGDSVLRSLIAAKGDSPLEVLGDPAGIIGKYGEAEGRNMLGTSVSAALNYTYAGNPLPDSPVGKVLQLMHDVPGIAPGIRTVRPFVRFSMATVPRFIWDRMGGMTLPVDLAMHEIWKTGRLSRGLQLDALQKSGGILDETQLGLASSRFKVSDTLNDSLSAMLEARQAKKGIDAIAKRGENTGALPPVQGDLDSLKATYDQATETANQKRAEYLSARQESKDLETSYEKSLKRANELREIDAPNWDQYIARQTTGALLMAVAFGVRSMASNDGTKYYQHRATPDSDPIDLREMLAGFAPYLHTADFFKDVLEHTDWKGLKSGKSMSEAYSGKYQTAQTLAQAMDDWFQVSYLTGTSGIVADLLTGRAPEALSDNAPQSLGLMFLQGVGEQLGRFTTGFQTLTDYLGAARPAEAISRTPERAGEATPLLRILFGPALAHIPGASESLPAKISPFTGAPIAKEHPGIHQATGLTFSPKLTLAEEEINRTGLAYGKAVPKVTGDQDLDNAVNHAFAQVVQQNLPAIVDSKEYKARSPELNRDVLESVFHEFKQAAYGQVAQTLDTPEAQKLMQSPAQKAKIQRWSGFLERQMKSEAKPGDEAGDQPEGGP